MPACDPTKETCEPSQLGKIVMHKYKRSSGDWRLKFKINHPMDTGLVIDPNSGNIIPEYHVNWLYFQNDKEELAKAQTYGALSANPTFILDFYLVLTSALLFFFNLVYLMPKINKLKDERNEKAFKISHFISVVINFAQLVMLGIVLA